MPSTAAPALLVAIGLVHTARPVHAFGPMSHRFRFASVHSSGMVLQSAPLASTVWGFGGGPSVSVSLDGEVVAVATRGVWLGQDTWFAKLPPQPAGFNARTLTATAADESVSLSSVIFGDVFVCAGQSNLNYPLNADPPAHPGAGGKVSCWDPANANCTLYNDTTVAACQKRREVGCGQCHYGCVNDSLAETQDMARYDDVLRLNVVAPCGSHTPAEPRPLLENTNTGWLPPSKMGGGFSAVCYFYARDLAKALTPRRPIGVVQASVGGTSNQFWSSDDAIATCQGLGKPWEWPATFRNGTGTLPGTGYRLPDVATGWNGKIVPLLRTVIKGAVWYQGESNTGMATPGGDARQYVSHGAPLRCAMGDKQRRWLRAWSPPRRARHSKPVLKLTKSRKRPRLTAPLLFCTLPSCKVQLQLPGHDPRLA